MPFIRLTKAIQNIAVRLMVKLYSLFSISITLSKHHYFSVNFKQKVLITLSRRQHFIVKGSYILMHARKDILNKSNYRMQIVIA